MFLQSFFDTSFNPRTISGRFIPQKQSSGHDTNRTNSETLWDATAFPNEFRDAAKTPQPFNNHFLLHCEDRQSPGLLGKG